MIHTGSGVYCFILFLLIHVGGAAVGKGKRLESGSYCSVLR